MELAPLVTDFAVRPGQATWRSPRPRCELGLPPQTGLEAPQAPRARGRWKVASPRHLQPRYQWCGVSGRRLGSELRSVVRIRACVLSLALVGPHSAPTELGPDRNRVTSTGVWAPPTTLEAVCRQGRVCPEQADSSARSLGEARGRCLLGD